MMRREALVAGALNLLVPGAGVVWLGQALLGVLIAVLFLLLLNTTIVAHWVFPGNFSPVMQSLLLGVTGGVYLGAHVRQAQLLRQMRRERAASERAEALRAARIAYLQGEYEAAWEALAPVTDRAGDDLLVAYRLAQVQTARRDVAAARSAWDLVRQLDRHHIYRDELKANQSLLGE